MFSNRFENEAEKTAKKTQSSSNGDRCTPCETYNKNVDEFLKSVGTTNFKRIKQNSISDQCTIKSAK